MANLVSRISIHIYVISLIYFVCRINVYVKLGQEHLFNFQLYGVVEPVTALLSIYFTYL